MRTWAARVLNLALYLSFCAMTGTGLMMAYRLPPGSQGGRGLTVAGLRRHEWGDIHLALSFAFVALIAVHLAMHWKWLVRVAGRESPARIWLGLGAGALIILMFLLIP